MIEFIFENEKYTIDDNFKASGKEKDLIQAIVDTTIMGWQPSDGFPILGVVDELEKLGAEVISYSDDFDENKIY